MKLINKSILTVVITLSTASVYYAQETQDTIKRSKDIEEVILQGVTDIAKDRKTPVAASTIKAAQIIERLGNQELTEILNTTPSVYATKSGGGYGDGGITMRGFESRNIAVMVNGMPVNDMEGGTVYYSNWTGLADVTSFVQAQRGLGSSKLGIASVGGTINYITRSADMKKGGVIRLGVGNNDYLKTSFAYNTGKLDKGWSSSFLMSRTAGGTYIENTDFEAYAYYFALGWEPNKKHNFQFTITSSPQWHDQRTFSPTIANYIKYNPDQDGTPYRQYNSDYGYYTDANGNKVALANRSNYYAKPVMMLNWDWNMNEKSKLSTVLYMSNGRGGGTGDLGRVGGKGATGYYDNMGHFNYDAIFAANQAVDLNNPATPAGSTLIRRASINSHNWYGILANFQHKINDNWNFSVGTDDRYYYGYHYQVVSDLYGAAGYKEAGNKNVAPYIVNKVYDYKSLSWNPFGGKTAPIGDQIGYSNDGEVLWYSGFAQVEYSKDNLSAFLQGSVSNQAYQRIDNFVKDGVTRQPNAVTGQIVNTKTGFKNLFGYNIKGGANYNINDNHNVFANIGYYSKQPFMNSVYPSNFQVLNPTLTNEKIFSAEVGYGFRSSKLNANVNLYRTEWKDRWFRRGGMTFEVVDPSSPTGTSTLTGYAEISGITQVHMGIEIDATYKPIPMLEFQGMLSIGDYKYKGNASGATFDDNNNPVVTSGNASNNTTLYLDGVKVGGSSSNSIPQMTASLGATIRPVKDLSIYGTWRYVGEIYSSIDPGSFSKPENQARGSLKLPDFNLFDVGFSYKIRLNNTSQYFTVGANVYNLLDTTYISDGATNIFAKGEGDFSTPQQYAAYQATLYKGLDPSNRVYFGFGRTWSANLSFNF
ncbi:MULTISPECIES: TonB-dependent receptor [Chryseobacterium]|uniref:TonB-dependent receptor n=1 Tax=Chryseobacterium TaxID=59732 RepID=UPI0023594B7C|nr:MULTISPECIES: TonB-dependent receptor plug domain-containing protein [unclassified Chryseobacterium]MDC8106279.1 TonB-dependent receptor plug domain-containing protein [Chryseobacterium sp. B21-037]MDQ1804785.1 TonB-dependent receptor plug domain-containing protein [Chryseobacterium sp. CKR4-1]WBV55498.1 TonB-dependent receptor plug domain-containing protein [Chryseobacterium daecheongense]